MLRFENLPSRGVHSCTRNTALLMRSDLFAFFIKLALVLSDPFIAATTPTANASLR